LQFDKVKEQVIVTFLTAQTYLTKGLFSLEGIEWDWRVLGGIKSSTSQNHPQSLPNPLVEGINRTSPKADSFHALKNLEAADADVSI